MHSNNQTWYYQVGRPTSPGFGSCEVRPQDHGRRDLADLGEAAIQINRIEEQEQKEEEEAGEEGCL